MLGNGCLSLDRLQASLCVQALILGIFGGLSQYCVVHLKCRINQRLNVVVHVILPLALGEFKLVEMDPGCSLLILILKLFYSLLGETIAFFIEPLDSCETAFEDV